MTREDIDDLIKALRQVLAVERIRIRAEIGAATEKLRADIIALIKEHRELDR